MIKNQGDEIDAKDKEIERLRKKLATLSPASAEKPAPKAAAKKTTTSATKKATAITTAKKAAAAPKKATTKKK